MSACKGFLYRSTNIINVENGKVEYVTIIGFDSFENLRLWISSGARKRHMEEAKAHSFLVFYINENGGSSDELMVEDMSFKEKRTDQCTLISRNDMANAAFVPRPPPKWKLFCIIWFGVYFAVLLEGFSGLSGLLASFGMPLYMLLFISLSHSVSILSFTFFPLLMSTSLVSKWLKATRPPPDQMSDIAKIFDMGLDMFTEIGALDAPSILERLQKLEGKVEKLKKINHDLSNKISDMQSTQLELKEAPETDNLTALEEGMNASVVTDESESDSTADVVGLSVEYRGKIVSDSGVTPPSTKPAPFLGKLQESSSYFSTRFSRKDIFKSYFSIDTAENITIKNSAKANNPSARESRSLSQNQNNMPLTLSVRNRVKWERTIDYEKWLNDMTKEMSRHAGFYGMATIQVPVKNACSLMPCYLRY